jgi:eukaryotic-like serine/threonine-protein kinase
LSDHIRHGGLPVNLVALYGAQVATALVHAHQRGIIHRDIKSTNVIITLEGTAKLLDFGLAKRLTTEELKVAANSRSSIAEVGPIAGTLSYLAPEVLRGKRPSAGSDIWALGVLLHEMAYGDLPFKGNTPFELSTQILTGQRLAPPRAIPPGLIAVIESCTQKDPGIRYQTAREVLNALADSNLTSTDSSAEPRARPLPWIRRSLLRGALGTALLLTLVFTLSTAFNPKIKQNAYFHDQQLAILSSSTANALAQRR